MTARFGFFLCVMAMLAGLPGPALASDAADTPMYFALVRSNHPGCEPVCPQWIAAEGRIVVGSAAKFARFLERIGPGKYPVIVHSPGGSVEDAMEIGRLIRKRGLDVAIGHTSFAGCSPPAPDCLLSPVRGKIYSGIIDGRGFCVSACPLMLAGGVARVAGWDGRIGVHQFSRLVRQDQIQYRITYKMVNGRKKEVGRKVVKRIRGKERTTTKLEPAWERKVLAHLAALGVSQELYEKSSKVPHESIAWLDRDEETRFGLVTEHLDAGNLADPRLCAGPDRAPHCAELEGERAELFAAGAIAAGEYTIPAERDMRFGLARHSSATCEPHCPQWIVAAGWIGRGTAERFAAFRKGLGWVALPVVFDSAGGDAAEAIELGRLLRAGGFRTAIGRTILRDCATDAAECLPRKPSPQPREAVVANEGALCFGACLAAFAGGVERHVALRSRVSPYHLMPWQEPWLRNGHDLPNGILLSISREDQGAIARHLEELGVEARLAAASRHSSRLRTRGYVSKERVEMRLVTSAARTEDILAPFHCVGSEAMSHCVADPRQSGVGLPLPTPRPDGALAAASGRQEGIGIRQHPVRFGEGPQAMAQAEASIRAPRTGRGACAQPAAARDCLPVE